MPLQKPGEAKSLGREAGIKPAARRRKKLHELYNLHNMKHLRHKTTWKPGTTATAATKGTFISYAVRHGEFIGSQPQQRPPRSASNIFAQLPTLLPTQPQV